MNADWLSTRAHHWYHNNGLIDLPYDILQVIMTRFLSAKNLAITCKAMLARVRCLEKKPIYWKLKLQLLFRCKDLSGDCEDWHTLHASFLRVARKVARDKAITTKKDIPDYNCIMVSSLYVKFYVFACYYQELPAIRYLLSHYMSEIYQRDNNNGIRLTLKRQYTEITEYLILTNPNFFQPRCENGMTKEVKVIKSTKLLEPRLIIQTSDYSSYETIAMFCKALLKEQITDESAVRIIKHFFVNNSFQSIRLSTTLTNCKENFPLAYNTYK